MLKQKLINTLKSSGLLYDLYYYTGSILLKLLGLFIKTNDKSILFVSFGGKKFNDSPRALYEYICKEKFFDDYQLIWAFNDPSKHEVGRAKKLKIDTFDFFKAALGSRIWISNSAVERGLNFKKKSTFYINTWHGTPIKKIGTDAISTSKKNGLGSKNIYTQDIMTSQSSFDAQIFNRLFKVDLKNILICDLPRNDFLTKYSNSDVQNIKKKLGIEKSKKIILYAPTYREFKRDKNNGCILLPPIDVGKWKERLGKDYVVLFRMHYEITTTLKLDNSFAFDVSDYENLNELMIISDLLISDYSSIYFDYSILEKPMLCFAYDFVEYSNKRGLYLDIEKELPCDIALSEDILLTQIINMDIEDAIHKTIRFKNKYITRNGKSAKTVIDNLKSYII